MRAATIPLRRGPEWNSRFEADYHVIEADSEIVYSYVMYDRDLRLSSSSPHQLDAVDDGAATPWSSPAGCVLRNSDAANAAAKRNHRSDEAARGLPLMTQLLKFQNFAVYINGFGTVEGREPRAAVRSRQPAR